jgi:hypothetical protein
MYDTGRRLARQNPIARPSISIRMVRPFGASRVSGQIATTQSLNNGLINMKNRLTFRLLQIDGNAPLVTVKDLTRPPAGSSVSRGKVVDEAALARACRGPHQRSRTGLLPKSRCPHRARCGTCPRS